jgi:hypothetical protein
MRYRHKTRHWPQMWVNSFSFKFKWSFIQKDHAQSECLHSAEIYSLTGCKAVSSLQTHDLKITTTCKADKKSARFSLVSTLSLEYLIPSTQLFFISRGTVTVRTYSGWKAVFAVWTHDLIPITAQQEKRVNIFFLMSTNSFSASHSTHLLHIQGDNHSKKTGMK